MSIDTPWASSSDGPPAWLRPGERALWRGAPAAQTALEVVSRIAFAVALCATALLWPSSPVSSGSSPIGRVYEYASVALFLSAAVAGTVLVQRRARRTAYFVTSLRAVVDRGRGRIDERPVTAPSMKVTRTRRRRFGTIDWGAAEGAAAPSAVGQWLNDWRRAAALLGLTSGSSGRMTFTRVTDLDSALTAAESARRAVGVLSTPRGLLAPDEPHAGHLPRSPRDGAFYFNPAPGWPEPSPGWRFDPATEWRPPPSWQPVPEHWPLFVWSDGHDQHGRSPTTPPCKLDQRPAGAISVLCAVAASVALAYCGVTLAIMAATHRPLLEGNSFLPPFVAIFPIWLWVVLVMSSRQARARRGRQRLFGRPLAPVRPSGLRDLVVIGGVVGSVVLALTLMCQLGPRAPAGQPGSNPATNQYWFDDHGALQYVSKSVWEQGAVGEDDLFTQGAVVFDGIALAVVWYELDRRRRVRLSGGTFPWL